MERVRCCALRPWTLCQSSDILTATVVYIGHPPSDIQPCARWDRRRSLVQGDNSDRLSRGNIKARAEHRRLYAHSYPADAAGPEMRDASHARQVEVLGGREQRPDQPAWSQWGGGALDDAGACG